MIKKIFKNVYALTEGNFPFEKCVEADNILKICRCLNFINDSWFENTLFVFSWNDDEIFPIEDFAQFNQRVLFRIGESHSDTLTNHICNSFTAVFQNHMNCDCPDRNHYALPLITSSKVPELEIIPLHRRRYNVFFSGNFNKNRVPLYLSLKDNVSLLETIWCGLNNMPGWSKLNKIFQYNRIVDLSNHFPESLINFNFKFLTGGFSFEEYAEITQNSKIVLSPKGFQYTECFRTYEAMRQGCIVISEPLPDVPFYKDIPIYQISDWKEVNMVVNTLLADDARMNRLSEESQQFYIDHLSNDAIAKYIYEKVFS